MNKVEKKPTFYAKTITALRLYKYVKGVKGRILKLYTAKYIFTFFILLFLP